MSVKNCDKERAFLFKATMFLSSCLQLLILFPFLLERYEAELDDYNKIMVKAIADRLAEVGALR